MKKKRYSFEKIKVSKKKEPMEPLFENQLAITILSVFAVVLLSLGGTLAVFSKTSYGTEYNVVKSGELSISYVDLNEEGNVLQLNNPYPVSDSVGSSGSAYRFSVENTGTLVANYVVRIIKDDDTIDVDGCSDNLLDITYIRYQFDNGDIGNLTDLLTSEEEGYVISSGTLQPYESNIHEIKLWLSDTSPNSVLGTHYHGKVVVDIEQGEGSDPTQKPNKTVTFGGVKKEVSEVTETMFNYTSEGTDPLGGSSVAATNGIYSMEDDDGTSYFYRGEVDNLVQFGKYEQDYYVYRYSSYDFVSLEACQSSYSSCSESNKVKKYEAGTPMYWKIVRINGDGTIRMIYVGGTAGATGYDTGIGLSRYNNAKDDPKYMGYTYDRTTTEVDSAAKTEVDNWYNTYLESTDYNSYIADGKFCNDTSDYGITTVINANPSYGPWKRFYADYAGSGNTTPTFKCPSTTETYGGNYTLKVGLITLDEIIAAGGQYTSNKLYYLYNGQEFWSMSPSVYSAVDSSGAFVSSAGSISYHFFVTTFTRLLRPVINLKADTVFESGGSGTIDNPYVVEVD